MAEFWQMYKLNIATGPGTTSIKYTDKNLHAFVKLKM